MSNEKEKFTYFITGGGTGGHIYPAVAVADALSEEDDTKDLYYVGNPENLEFEIVKGKEYKFLPVNVHGMPRQFGIPFIKWCFQITTAFIKCCGYIRKYKPDAVFGTGGYVSAPILMACMAFKRGHGIQTPYMLHDCDAQPGLVSRKFAPDAGAVSLAFECAKKVIKNDNCFINGNPLRPNFKTLTKFEARQDFGLGHKITLCIMGGSQGSRTINDASVEILKTLSQKYDVQIIFQTGKKNFERVIEQLIKIYPEYEQDKNIMVKPYFDDMVTVLKASDIAVSRAGSLSLSEICASGIAPILVPYPHAAADHQRKNAKYMVEQGAALYLEDNEVNEKTLLSSVLSLLTDKEKLIKTQQGALRLAKYDGVKNIVEQLKNLIK